MNRFKFKINKIKEKITTEINHIKEEELIDEYIKNNILFLTYVIVCVLNASLLRVFCIPTFKSLFSIKAIIGDLPGRLDI